MYICNLSKTCKRMNKIKPLDFSITSINDSGKAFRTGYIFLTNEFGILYDMSHIIQKLLATNHSAELPGPFFFKLKQPYRLREGRIVFLLQGEVTIRYNLIEYTVRPSQILVVPIGSIVEIVNVKPDTLLRMTGFSPSFASFARKDDHWGYKQRLIIPLSDSERNIANEYFKLIWDTVQAEDFHREAVQHLIVAFLHYINYIRKEYHSTADIRLTHQDELFNRFIALVNKHSIRERNVSFYADKLCLTPRYLNTVIRQVSGQTVMEWVNQSIIIEAKILLKHDNLLIYQVADKLNFSNPSFFCKFFKRMTGKTPQEYQSEA